MVQGYCFGIYQQHMNHGVLTDVKTFYIDDLCVLPRETNTYINTTTNEIQECENAEVCRMIQNQLKI